MSPAAGLRPTPSGPARAGVLCGVLTLVVMLATACAPPPGPRPDGPAIRLDRTDWAFGTIERGETVTTALRISNAGTEPLAVALHTSCECFTVSADSLSVSPGAYELITLAIQGPAVKDPTVKSLFVDSNDRTVPRITLTAYGVVTPGRRPHLAATPDPAPITLPDSAADYLAADILIENRGREDLVIAAVRYFGATGDWAQAVLEGGESSVLHVESLAGWSGQRWLEIDSNDPVLPLKKIVLVDMK